MTITWHVDDFKILHVDADEVTKVIDLMKGIYGRHMKESCGKKHYYLRMELDFSVDEEVRVTMMDYLKKILYDLPETIQGIVMTPAAEYPFTLR